MAKTWFTSDFHAGELRTPNTHSYLRPYPTQVMVEKWIEHLKSNASIGDRIIFVGDVGIQLRDLNYVLDSLKDYNVILILGDKETNSKNYTFDEFVSFMNVNYPLVGYYKKMNIEVNGRQYYITHKPEDCLKQDLPSICGHIHGIWRTAQMPNGEAIINVGIDAWGGIVSEEFIEHQYNAITKYYDVNAKPYHWINEFKR